MRQKVLYLFRSVSLIGRMDYTIVSKLALCWERGVWTRAEMHTLDAPLGDSEFRSLNPRFLSNAWEHHGRWVEHPFQVSQEQEPEW